MELSDKDRTTKLCKWLRSKDNAGFCTIKDPVLIEEEMMAIWRQGCSTRTDLYNAWRDHGHSHKLGSAFWLLKKLGLISWYTTEKPASKKAGQTKSVKQSKLTTGQKIRKVLGKASAGTQPDLPIIAKTKLIEPSKTRPIELPVKAAIPKPPAIIPLRPIPPCPACNYCDPCPMADHCPSCGYVYGSVDEFVDV
ncbi:MAG: hypothetical protein WCF94_02170 [bacterium]